MQEYTLAQNRWYGDEPTTISLLDDWDVQFLSSRGDERSALSAEQIRERFRHPVGSRTIRELAENAEQVVIVFDDLTRGTPVQPIAEAVLEELHAAGIPKNHIRFICGTGLHGAHSRNDFARKLGERIIREYAVFNHNPYDNCAEVGFTPNGIRVSLNREFLSCDLKIAIGGVVPHPLNGFGGGGKIIMPGIASAETINGTHATKVKSSMSGGKNPLAGSGNLSDDSFRSEVEACCCLSGLNVVCDALLNTRCEMWELVVGDPLEAYYEAVRRADGMYGVKLGGQKNVVIANANAKASEAGIAMYTGMMALQPPCGDLVLVDFTPGQCVHFGSGPMGFLPDMGGRAYSGIRDRISLMKRLIVYSPYPDYTSACWFCKPEQMIWCETWDEVLALISDNGPGTTAAIFSDATIQYIEHE